MQQRLFGRPLGVVERDGAAARQFVGARLPQCVAGQEFGAAALAPEPREMALAAARRARQHERRRRPVGPALDRGEGGLVAAGDEKIGAAERRAVRQLEGELGQRTRVRLVAASFSLSLES
jgi:hypothetical protein